MVGSVTPTGSGHVSKDEFAVRISKIVLIDRLKVMQNHMTDDNLHTDAFMLELTIQALTGTLNEGGSK